MVSSSSLDPLAAAHRLHGDLGLVLGAVGTALAYSWDPLSRGVPRLRG